MINLQPYSENNIDAPSGTTCEKFSFNPSLDCDFLGTIYDGDLEYAAEMFEIFLESVPHDMQELIRFMNVNNHSAIYQTAHKIKPTFSMVGLSEEGVLMEKIQQLGHDRKGEYESYILQIESILMNRIPSIKNEHSRLKKAI